MASANAYSGYVARSIVLGSLVLAACGSDCSDEGCISGIFLEATLDAAPGPWTVDFCRAGTCSMCRLDVADISTECSGIRLSLALSDGSATARLAVSSQRPPFNDGDALELHVTSPSADTLLDWKGTAKYERITTGGPRCETPGHCSTFTKDIQ